MIDLMHGDCLELMKQIPDKSVDMILCDLPYGVTACKWDSVIPFDKLWGQYKRIVKGNGAIVLNCQQPFTSELIQSNKKDFKYCWQWYKHQCTGFFNAKKQPLRNCEDIAVFYSKQCTYNPIMRKGKPQLKATGGYSENYGGVLLCHIFRKIITPLRFLKFLCPDSKADTPHKSPSPCANTSLRPTPTRAKQSLITAWVQAQQAWLASIPTVTLSA